MLITPRTKAIAKPGGESGKTGAGVDSSLSRTHREARAGNRDRERVHSSGSRDKMSASGDCSDEASDVWLTEGAV